jgi:hypothetical protein
MVATAVLLTLHVAVVVTTAVELSLYVAVAMNCWVFPTSKLALLGVTAMPVTVFAVTVSIAVPLCPPIAALIVLEPMATLLARPVALMVAMAGAELVQVAVLLTLAVVPLL